ncbi:MAG: hypothetical protein HY698_18525 [Deltaproteobacteria bacterium]|nr:hypothetical protein [Deltaproteobacteria bacterium]
MTAMKKLLSLSSIAAFAFAGCASDQAPSTERSSTEQSVIVAAGEKPMALGIGSYEIHSGAETYIHLRDLSGVEIGTVRGSEANGIQESSIELDSSDSPFVLRMEGKEMAVFVGTVEKIRVRFIDGGAEVVRGAFPREYTREMNILRAVLTDAVIDINLTDFGSNMCTTTEDGRICASFKPKSDNRVPNCPWWVTVGSCAGGATGAGGVVCAGCLGVGFGNALNDLLDAIF